MDNDSLNKKTFYVRLGLSVIVFIAALVNSLTAFAITQEDPECIVDKTHIFLNSVNNFFKSTRGFKFGLMIITALIYDIGGVALAYAWIMFIKTWRPVVIIVLYLALKLFCQYIFIMKYPDDNLWEFPGFPSLLISYKHSNNFFFSGPVGLSIIFGYELTKLDSKVYRTIGWIVYSNIALQVFLDLSIRSHYFIDIVAGYFAAHYLILVADSIYPYFDKLYPLDENVDMMTGDNYSKLNGSPTLTGSSRTSSKDFGINCDIRK